MVVYFADGGRGFAGAMMDGEFPMFFWASCAMQQQHSATQLATCARRSESGLSGGWGTTGLSVPVRRLYVSGYVCYLGHLDQWSSAENGEAGPNYRALFASTLREGDRDELEGVRAARGELG